MFRKNEGYIQFNMFGIEQNLTAKQKKMWEESIEHRFFENIFKRIDEQRFSVLYSDKKSRPNVPVNQLVGSLILKHLYDWSYAELFKHLSFNMLTRHAIGIQGLSEDIFAEASIFNFQNRVIEHFLETGEDLLIEIFDSLTAEQLKEFGIDTSIQRGDSFLIGSNIFDYTRLQLLIEVLLRLHRILKEEDKELFKDSIINYTKQTAGQYIYRVEKEDLPKELEQLSKIYHELHTKLKEKYEAHSVFKIFERVYYEHFTIVDEQLQVIDSGELHSAILMSPDDTDATYRTKGREDSKGYVGHLSETANPDNPFDLITDIATYQNNVGDAQILEERLPEMKQKTPEIEEYFVDGLYGSPAIDELMEKYGITQYQTAIRGRKSYGEISIERKEDETVWVSCGGGQVVQAQKQKRWKAVFDFQKCSQCPLAEKCNTRISGTKRGIPKRTYYFEEKHILRHTRFKNFEKLPEEKKTIRANVEATVKEEKRGIKNGKVRVRTKIRIGFYLALTSIAINLTRIHKFMNQKVDETLFLLFSAIQKTIIHMVERNMLFGKSLKKNRV